MNPAKCFKLRDGRWMPKVGFGTYKVGFIPASASGSGGVARIPEGENVVEIAKWAVNAGYRCFDCAEYYQNEDKVGLALSECGIPRDELFILSKVWTTTMCKGREAIFKQVQDSLKALKIDYFDLYLIHWPVPGYHVDAYKCLEELVERGYIRSIGLSNYTVEDYKELIKTATIPPVVNQIEINPFMYRKSTIKFFQDQNVVLQAYRSLGNGKCMNNPELLALASKYNKPVSQIMGRFLVQNGISCLGKSTKECRIKENFGVLDFEMEEVDIEQLKNLTTSDAIKAYEELYWKCIVRDTPLEGKELERWQITSD